MIKENKRTFKFDLIRCIAILCVLYCHSVECYYYIFQNRSILWTVMSFKSKLFDLIGLTIGRLGVPLFLFLTGILISKKNFDNSNKDIPNFYKKSVFSLLLTFELWIIIWNLFAYILFLLRNESSSLTLFSLLQNLFLLKTVDYILPAWYIPMIMGIYLFIPFLVIILKKIDIKTAKLSLIIMVIILFLLPSINQFLLIYNISLISDLNLSFSGGIYGLYIILGYYIEKGWLRKISTYKINIMLIISSILCVLMQYLLLQNNNFYKLEYNNIFLLITSCCLLEVLLRKGEHIHKFKKTITYISNISFPLFLIHNLIQYILYQSKVLSNFKPFISVILMFFISTIVTITIVEIISKNKILKKYLLKMK